MWIDIAGQFHNVLYRNNTGFLPDYDLIAGGGSIHYFSDGGKLECQNIIKSFVKAELVKYIFNYVIVKLPGNFTISVQK